MGANVFVFGPPWWRFFFALALIIQDTIQGILDDMRDGNVDRDTGMKRIVWYSHVFKTFVSGMGLTLPCPHCTRSCMHFVSSLDDIGMDPLKSCISMGSTCSTLDGAKLTPLRYAYTLRNRVNKKLQAQHVDAVLARTKLSPDDCKEVAAAMFPSSIKFEAFVRRLRLYSKHVFEEDLDIVLHSLRVNFYENQPQAYLDFMRGLHMVLRVEGRVGSISPLRVQAEALEWSLQWATRRSEAVSSVGAFENWLLQIDAVLRGVTINTAEEAKAFREKICTFYDDALSVACGEKTCD